MYGWVNSLNSLSFFSTDEKKVTMSQFWSVGIWCCFAHVCDIMMSKQSIAASTDYTFHTRRWIQWEETINPSDYIHHNWQSDFWCKMQLDVDMSPPIKCVIPWIIQGLNRFFWEWNHFKCCTLYLLASRSIIINCVSP